MWSNKKLFFRWWLIAALIYLIFSAVVTWQYGTDFLMPMGDDSAHHIKLAENLIKYHTFSLDGLNSNSEPLLPLKPTNFLSPGYAFWLVIIFLIFKSFTPAIFIGAIIFAISVPLTYLLAREITGNNKIAFWAALIFMIEPLSVYHSGLLFTEQIFVPMFLTGIYCFVKYIKNGNFKFLSGSLITLSAATLVRPVLFYFLPVLVFIVLFKEFKISIKRALILGIISLVLVYSIIGVWIVRNKIVLNTWQISSNTGAILYGYHYESLMRNLDLTSENPKILGGNRDAFSVEYNKILGNFAVGEILKHKTQYLKLRLVYTPLFFLSNGYDNILSRFYGTAGFDKYFRSDLVNTFMKGEFIKTFKTIFDSPKSMIFLLGSLFWFFIFVLAALGFWRNFKDSSGPKIIWGFIAVLILYFDIVTTPLVTARYRLPINPFIFIFAVTGFLYLKQLVKKND